MDDRSTPASGCARARPRGCLLLLLAGLALAPAAPAAAQGLPPAGVQTHLLWGNVTRAEMERQLDEVRSLGAGTIRVDVGWSSLQESNGRRYSRTYLERLDTLVAEAESRGIELLLTVTWTPCWASRAPASLKRGCSGAWWRRGVQYYPPTKASRYGRAVGFLAKRYRGRVAAWELWNEPNSTSYFKSSSPRAYVKLVRAAYGRIKHADPATTVVAGSLSSSDFEFTRRLYRRGIKGHFDAFSIHPYSDDRSPLDPRTGHSPRGSFVRGVPAVHEEMLRNGDDRPLWLTEFGWNTSNVRDAAPWLNGVSETTQAQYLEEAMGQVEEWDYVPVAVWFGLKNTAADQNDSGANFGLLRADNTRKPAHAAFRRAAPALAASKSS